LDEVRASAEEIAYLCEGASEYFRTPVTPADVVWTYSGVRPLVDDGSGKPEAATRGYRFELDGGADGEAPLLSVFGGKITTYRELASEAIDELEPFLPVLAGADWTGTASLPGGDFGRYDAPALSRDLAARYAFLGTAEAARLVRLYGTLAAAFLGDATRAEDLGEAFGHCLTAAEVDYLISREWARSADDVLWRRTKLGLHFTPDQTARLAAYITRRTNPA
jgi:glycerol-3-phosphate dehydrogenase